VSPTPAPAPIPPPRGWWDHRCPGLKAAGALEACPLVARANWDVIAALAGARPLFLDTSLVRENEELLKATLSARFEIRKVDEALYRLLSLPR